MLQFENIQIPVPAMYDEVLRAEYGGDYMTPVQGAADHDYPFYGHMEEELKKQIKAVGFDGSVEEFCRGSFKRQTMEFEMRSERRAYGLQKMVCGKV